jgi:hypothetical protein
MTVDSKIRLGLFLVSAALSVFATVAAAHGIYVGASDPIGGGTP